MLLGRTWSEEEICLEHLVRICDSSFIWLNTLYFYIRDPPPFATATASVMPHFSPRFHRWEQQKGCTTYFRRSLVHPINLSYQGRRKKEKHSKGNDCLPLVQFEDRGCVCSMKGTDKKKIDGDRYLIPFIAYAWLVTLSLLLPLVERIFPCNLLIHRWMRRKPRWNIYYHSMDCVRFWHRFSENSIILSRLWKIQICLW